jgi:hypothetical protein
MRGVWYVLYVPGSTRIRTEGYFYLTLPLRSPEIRGEASMIDICVYSGMI